jgi:anti-sigma factor RsiW
MNAHLLGEIEGEDARVLECHLAECAACRETESRLRNALTAFAGVRPQHPRRFVLVSLLAAQGKKPSRLDRSYPSGRGLRATGAIAAGLVIFISGFWTGRQAAPAGGDRGPEASRAGFEAGAAGNLHREPPRVTFAAAVPDRIAGQAVRDTTVN